MGAHTLAPRMGKFTTKQNKNAGGTNVALQGRVVFDVSNINKEKPEPSWNVR